MSIFEQSHLKSFPSPYHALTQEVLALANGQPLPPRQTEELCYTDCTARHREASSTPAESFNSTYSSLSLTPSPFSSPSSYAASSFNSISFISSSPSLVIPSPAPSPFSTTFVSPDTNVYPSHLYRTPDHNILNNTVEGPHDHALASEAVLPTSQSNSVAPYPSASEGPIITPLAKPVLLLLPLMLGSGIRVPVRHTDLLLRLLADPLCVGLIGGRPRHSVYMAGCQGDRVIYFDPHFVQDCVDVSNGNFNVRTWHCSTLRTMRARRLDPSCAIGFFCSQPTDISALLDRLPALTALACTPVTRSGPKSSDNFPLFSKKSTIGDSKPADSRFQVASTTASHNTSRPFNSKTFKLDLLDRPNFNTTSQSPPARLIPKRSLIEVFDSPLDLVTSRRIPNKAGNGRLVDMAEHENLKSMFRYLDETSLLVDPEAAIVVSSESAN